MSNQSSTLNTPFLRGFFNQQIGFFTRPLPSNEEVFMTAYDLANLEWIAFQKVSNDYPIASDVKQNLEALFDKAEVVFYKIEGVTLAYPQAILTLEIRNLWREVNILAKKIQSAMSRVL